MLSERAPFEGYAYSYPHKTAYRPLAPPRPLRELWADEEKDALFLYLHVPFCEMRCGFCNLFTLAAEPGREVTAYLEALERQAAAVREEVGAVSVARLAIGGGTPTHVGAMGLERLFAVAEAFGADPPAIPVSVEASPGTADRETLAWLAGRGVDRLSLGVQSFDDRDLLALGRPSRGEAARAALERVRAAGFARLNVDLIYGIPGQAAGGWLASLEAALRFAPEELYLYPLYVRPLTGLGRRTGGASGPADARLTLYREARALLLGRGYVQLSMRLFRRADRPETDGPSYCCQEDGLLGLGCGARSYTRRVHYSTDYAVGRPGVREILAAYVSRPAEGFRSADYGIELDEGDQRRRYVIKSLLRAEGLLVADYERRFKSRLDDDLPQLGELEAEGWAARGGGAGDGRLCLTPAGLERSDSIGPWLYSAGIRRLMDERVLR